MGAARRNAPTRVPVGAPARPGRTRHGSPRRGRRVAGWGLALAVVLAAGILASLSLLPHHSSPSSSRPSLNTKTTCVYTGGTTAGLADFAQLTGRPANCVLLYNDANTTWDQLVQPWFTRPSSDWRQWLAADPKGRRMVLSQEMVPDQVPANWRQLGAAGAYDRYARELATNLVAAGMGNSVIRLGHEMNGTWYHDSLGTDPAQYGDWTTYWARMVRVMRSVPGAHFLFDWNVNAGHRNIPLSSYYPGNSVVDVIGVDIYDSGMPGSPADPAVRWARLASEPGGLDEIAAFARQHGKPLSFPEWGVVSADSGGLGDDPAYVTGIAGAIKDNKVLYQAYFDHPVGGVIVLQDAPQSLRLWDKYFGRLGVIGGRSW